MANRKRNPEKQMREEPGTASAESSAACEEEKTDNDENIMDPGGEEAGDQGGKEAGDSGGEPESGSEDVPKVLTAVYPILYLSHQYNVGDLLPANDPDMTEAWLAAGTAAWVAEKQPDVKAKPKTAAPGLPGQADASGTGNDLVGKVPVPGGGRSR